MTNSPTWSTISAIGIQNLKISSSVKKVYIWADLDRTDTGEKAACELAMRLYHCGIVSVIKLPPKPIPQGQKSHDWLDVFQLNKINKGN